MSDDREALVQMATTLPVYIETSFWGLAYRLRVSPQTALDVVRRFPADQTFVDCPHVEKVVEDGEVALLVRSS